MGCLCRLTVSALSLSHLHGFITIVCGEVAGVRVCLFFVAHHCPLAELSAAPPWCKTVQPLACVHTIPGKAPTETVLVLGDIFPILKNVSFPPSPFLNSTFPCRLTWFIHSVPQDIWELRQSPVSATVVVAQPLVTSGNWIPCWSHRPIRAPTQGVLSLLSLG